jgi:hypothetical protein
MPYRVGSKGSYGCSGYPAVKDDGTVMGCHKTRAEAAGQIYAINQSEGNIGKSMDEIKEGDFVMGATTEGLVHGVVEHIMVEGGTLGTPGTRYALESMPPENPAMSVRVYKEEDSGWEPTAYSIGMMYADAQKIDIEEHSMDAEETMDMEDNDMDIDKAKKPNYQLHLIQDYTLEFNVKQKTSLMFIHQQLLMHGLCRNTSVVVEHIRQKKILQKVFGVVVC